MSASGLPANAFWMASIFLLGALRRALHVGEQHGDLLALACEGGLRWFLAAVRPFLTRHGL
jgi:hypothetical protein